MKFKKSNIQRHKAVGRCCCLIIQLFNKFRALKMALCQYFKGCWVREFVKSGEEICEVGGLIGEKICEVGEKICEDYRLPLLDL